MDCPMAALELPAAAPWPPQPLKTERLTLRAPQTSDQPWLVELFTSPQTRRFLGGPLALADAEAACSGPFGRTPGSFVAETTAGEFVGTVGFDRRDAGRPGHVQPGGEELEISYALTPRQWGQGYGVEAVGAALTWAAESLPDDRVVACTQTANTRSTALLRRAGFTDTDQRFSEFDVDQSLWQRSTR